LVWVLSTYYSLRMKKVKRGQYKGAIYNEIQQREHYDHMTYIVEAPSNYRGDQFHLVWALPTYFSLRMNTHKVYEGSIRGAQITTRYSKESTDQ
jgi:hypothetical protein